MSTAVALIVDDEPDICELLSITLKRMSIQTEVANDLAHAREFLHSHEFHICLTDMHLPDGDGLTLVAEIQRQYPRLPVAVITAHGNMETAIQALKCGAFDFLTKPVDLASLRKMVTSAIKLAEDIPRGARLVGESAAMKRTRAKIAKVARSQAPVYISGESGTGKELVARTIHELGARAQQPFVAVNCGAIPHDLMESEFFGYKKGSFTGAVSDKPGLFQAADGGTLFLDEVGELPLSMQVKLLRAIQEKSIRALGTQSEVKIDVRILSATHKDLAQLVASSQFRQDLFYRINVIQLDVPPLRDRRDDIPLLAEFLLDRMSREHNMENPHLTQEATDALNVYAFPGNVRELENILERALTMADGAVIDMEALNLPVSSPTVAVDNGDLSTRLSEVEKREILFALEQSRWNKTAAAKLLGISFRALRYRMEKLNLE